MTPENKKKKEYLESEIWYRQRIKNIEEELRRLRVREVNPAINPDKIPSRTDTKDIADYIESVEELTAELYKTRSEMMEKKAEIHRAINSLPTKYACLLEQKYLLGKQFHEIANELHYSESHLYLMHGEALSMLDIK